MSRGPSQTQETKIFLLVDSGPCPGQSDIKAIQKGTTGKLSCQLEQLFTSQQSTEVHWLKDCKPIDLRGKSIRISNFTESDEGNYTCQINFTLEGKTYTTSRTTLLTTKEAQPIAVEPKVMYPRNETMKVELGVKAELTCAVFIGSEDAEIESLIYWTVNYSFIECNKHLNQSLEFERRESDELYGLSRLLIAEVRPEFFHVPFHCIITNSVGQDVGVVWLSPANHNVHTHVITYLAILVIIVGVVIYHVFKVEMVLAYRRLCSCTSVEISGDGKLYDAYVCHLHGEALHCSRAEEFCLQVLPEVLEKRHGYKLFISGRDDLPGEVVHDAISDTIRNSRRLIIVLSAQSQDCQDNENQMLLDQNQKQHDFEHFISLYDALNRNGLRIILLETDKDIDYSILPKSVQYIKKKQGALRWRHSNGNPTASPNGRFWKCLRYRMPTETNTVNMSNC
ncbi:interleukin-1 receptor type 1 [Megalops cyprinoides]|uniref:interleukin-1 receptor type 1 n=1 Tax=Megalops cyprinoides TaxID=118141 RepID=UPI001863BBBE|nr:interleukin-1 receptor type 1 [Megalops cyprinoides]